MTEAIDLPPEIEQVADLLIKQRPEVRALFRYALVLAMIDDEKAHVIRTRVEEEREWLTVETVASDVFAIARPPISEELEAVLVSEVRSIMNREEIIFSVPSELDRGRMRFLAGVVWPIRAGAWRLRHTHPDRVGEPARGKERIWANLMARSPS